MLAAVGRQELVDLLLGERSVVTLVAALTAIVAVLAGIVGLLAAASIGAKPA